MGRVLCKGSSDGADEDNKDKDGDDADDFDSVAVGVDDVDDADNKEDGKESGTEVVDSANDETICASGVSCFLLEIRDTNVSRARALL